MINFYKFCTHRLNHSELEYDIAYLSVHGVNYEYDYGRILNIIRKNPEDAYIYAREIMGKRWPEAEPYIMKDIEYLYWYIKYVIKERWLEAELEIMELAPYAYQYARDIIKGRWPEAEPIIMTDNHYAFLYARDVIKGRWFEAEPSMSYSDGWWVAYRWEFGL